MTKFALGLMVFLMPSLGVAQQKPTQTVQGCLSRINHNHWVITADGGGPRQYRVVAGDDSALSKLNGHTVQAVGQVDQSDPAQQAVEPPNPGSTTGATYNRIAIQQIRDVTSNCSELGFAQSK